MKKSGEFLKLASQYGFPVTDETMTINREQECAKLGAPT
jgi:hypothetical protein